MNDKTKSLFTPWKLGTTKKFKYLFQAWYVLLKWNLFQLIVLSKLDSNCFNSFLLSRVDKVTSGT